MNDQTLQEHPISWANTHKHNGLAILAKLVTEFIEMPFFKLLGRKISEVRYVQYFQIDSGIAKNFKLSCLNSD
jgi:hypothetical protein